MTDRTPSTETVAPCPWCGCTRLSVTEGSTFRWRVLSCDDCGANTGEHRIQTMGDGTKPEWEARCREEMLAVWNLRHAPEPRTEVALNQGPRRADGVGSNPDLRAQDQQSPEPGGDYVLPCDVKLPPNTVIGKGCKLSTLMHALRNREGKDVPRFLDIPAIHAAADSAFNQMVTRMIVCPVCGNKRCPKAEDERFKCTNSNELDQVGELESPETKREQP